jgi:type IV pilus assembly protein PilV
MIDVLVAMVVLSIGLLGLAGLQATGLRYNHGAYLSTQATLQAYDMADRMRANMAGVDNGDYDGIKGLTAPPVNCALANCSSPADMAKYDAYQWNLDNKNLLPSGKGTVTKTASLYTIKVTWDDAGQGSMKFTTAFQP